ncbi:MAG: 30S ribosomal protein S21 [Planctomycetota bacterium]
MPISITVREHDNLERVLKRFNRLCQREGLQKAVKRYSYYEKPSEKRRRKIKERMRNIRKQARIQKKMADRAVARARRMGHA